MTKCEEELFDWKIDAGVSGVATGVTTGDSGVVMEELVKQRRNAVSRGEGSRTVKSE